MATNILRMSEECLRTVEDSISLFKEECMWETEDALSFLILDLRLLFLEESLEEVRRNEKNRELHDLDFQSFDTVIQVLLSNFHLGKVEGGFEELAKAETFQTKLSSVKFILNNLNKVFLDRINIHRRHDYYTTLDISSLTDEAEINDRILKVSFAIRSILEIKHGKIIPELCKFLIIGKSGVKCFLEYKIYEFQKCRSKAILLLESCIEGHDELLSEIDTVKEQCIGYMWDLLDRMRNVISADTAHLKKILKHAKMSNFSTDEIFHTGEHVDDYFVLPFATYINVLDMCAVMSDCRSFRKHSDTELPYLDCMDITLCRTVRIFDFNQVQPPALAHLLKLVMRLQKPSINHPRLKANDIIEEFQSVLRQFDGNYLELRFRVCDYGSKIDPRIHPAGRYVKLMQMFKKSKTNEKKIKIDNTQLNKDNAKLKNDSATLKDENSNLKNDNKNLNDDNATLKDENFSLRNDNKKLNDDNIKLNDDNIKLNDDNTKCDDKNSKLKSKNKKLNEDNTKLNNGNAKLNHDVKELYHENSKFKNDNKRLNDDNTKLINDNAELIDEITKLNYEITKLKNYNTRLNHDNTKLNDDNTELFDEISKLQNHNETLKDDNTKLNDDNAKLDGEIIKLKDDNKILVSNIQDYEDKYDCAMKQIEEFHHKEKELSEKKKLRREKKFSTLGTCIQTL